MERKTIGGFIAALRKANGMTQKELAAKLNVSDKTISRWERDDGAPDLSAIPVIAEIFGVTCDELLRGARTPPAQRMECEASDAPTPKGEKQRQRILTVSLSKYKTRSFIAMGVATAGLIAAMIGNFGFLRAYIGFLVGAIFYLGSIICQAVFVNGAFLCIADDELGGTEVGAFKYSVIRLAQWVISLTAVLLGATLPLAILPQDTYMGLGADSWFLYGLEFGLLTLALCAVVCWCLNSALLNRGVFSLPEKKEQAFRHNRRLKRRCALLLAAALLVTGIAHSLVTSIWDAVSLSKSTEFQDYARFIAYMEQDIPYTHYYNGGATAVEQVAPQTYYDASGNPISEEEALRETLCLYDGTAVCEYVRRNQAVCSIRYKEQNGTILPISVVTFDDLRGGQARLNLIHAAFTAAYCLEVLGTLLLYWKKRSK